MARISSTEINFEANMEVLKLEPHRASFFEGVLKVGKQGPTVERPTGLFVSKCKLWKVFKVSGIQRINKKVYALTCTFAKIQFQKRIQKEFDQ